MRRERTNNLVIFVYSLLAILLCAFIIFYIYATRPKAVETVIEHPLVDEYTVMGEVLSVAAEDRLLTVRSDEEELYVGLLPEAIITNQSGQAVDLTSIQPGDRIGVKIDFIGTGAILASEVILYD